MKKFAKYLSVSVVGAYAFISTNAVVFAAVTAGWGNTSGKPGGVATDIRSAMMDLTDWVLGFIAIIATLVIIYGGIQYMTAGGNDDAVGKAKKTISYGIIGMVVAGLAYAMVIVVTTILVP